MLTSPFQAEHNVMLWSCSIVHDVHGLYNKSRTGDALHPAKTEMVQRAP